MTMGSHQRPIGKNQSSLAPLTDVQKKALKWLADRHGDGVFDRHGVLLAAGESAPFMRSTWNALRDHGLLEFYNPAGKGYGRARVVKAVPA